MYRGFNSSVNSNNRAQAYWETNPVTSKKKVLNKANQKVNNNNNNVINRKPGGDRDAKSQLLHLILRKKWRLVRNLLQSTKQAYLLCQQRDILNASCLAIAMGAAAPLDIIRLMVDIDQNMLSMSDENNATPLHLGCLNGASFECIDYLLSFDYALARMIDVDMRSPLHHAVEYAIYDGIPAMCARKSLLRRQNRHPPSTYMDIIQRLCHAAPDMIYVQDADNKTPIDLIQQVKVKKSERSTEYQMLDEIYQYLTYTSIQVYKENKRVWESEAYHRHLSSDPNIVDS
jgi:hypothetical protein